VLRAGLDGDPAQFREFGNAGLTAEAAMLCLYVWRSVISEEASDNAAQRGDGPRLVGNFLQMVELH
jgi:hypothetical protein